MSSRESNEAGLPGQAVQIAVRGVRIWQYVPTWRLAFTAEHAEEIEPELLDWIESLPEGAVFYDLGASNGLFSLYAALRVRARVVAFEPEAQNYAVMEANNFLNRSDLVHPIVTLNIALSNTVGLGRIYCRRYLAGEHNKILDVAQLRDTGEEFRPEHVQFVPRYPLDRVIGDLGLPSPHFVKIDVDGAELDVLGGAREALGNPDLKAVFIEVYEPGTATGPVRRTLAEAGFRLCEQVPVAHPQGGRYEGLFNCIFERG